MSNWDQQLLLIRAMVIGDGNKSCRAPEQSESRNFLFAICSKHASRHKCTVFGNELRPGPTHRLLGEGVNSTPLR